MIPIVIAVAALSGLGVLFGLVIAWCSKTFYVPVDRRVERVTALLPGVNCGGCGMAGCMNFAEALVAGEASLDACAVCALSARRTIEAVLKQPAASDAPSGHSEPPAAETTACVLCTVAEKQDIACALGQESPAVPEDDRKQAVIACGGGLGARNHFFYEGIADCRVAVKTLGGYKECGWACVEQQNCVRACPFNAIRYDESRGVPVVVPELCRGCEKCVAACPRGIISMISRQAKIIIRCSSQDKGAAVMKKCKHGCIACGKCVKQCPHHAIQIINNLATIDYASCVGCLDCVAACPTRCICVVTAERLIAARN